MAFIPVLRFFPVVGPAECFVDVMIPRRPNPLRIPVSIEYMAAVIAVLNGRSPEIDPDGPVFRSIGGMGREATNNILAAMADKQGDLEN